MRPIITVVEVDSSISLVMMSNPPGHGGDDWETVVAPISSDTPVRVSGAVFNNEGSPFGDHPVYDF